MSITIIAYGNPAPQGSKRHVGNGVMVESSKNVKPWREAVHWAARETRKAMPDGQFEPPIDEAVVLRMIFTMPKPKSAPKTRRTYPCRTPDLSKLVRSTEDAIVTAGVLSDDARIVEYERLAKVFPNEDPEALDVPGVRITIRRVEGLA